MTTAIRGVTLCDANGSREGDLLIEGGWIHAAGGNIGTGPSGSDPRVSFDLGDPSRWVLLPAFVELHAHLRDPGFTDKENLESGLFAAAAGGYGSLVCMGNTRPVLDDLMLAEALYARAGALSLCELFPVLTLTKGMTGRSTRHLDALRSFKERHPEAVIPVRLLSEDGRDVADDDIFLEAFRKAAALGLPVSCHCDSGGGEAEASKALGEGRAVWSRIEEDAGTERALRLGEAALCHVHIAHVSTKKSVQLVREAKARHGAALVTAEATPLHFSLTEETARKLGEESFGRVNPPLRTEEDRQAVIEGILDGTIDAIATDHAPHTQEDKAAGSPGFSGLETAFAVSKRALVDTGLIPLSRLSALLSANPARILGLGDRALLAEGKVADLALVDLTREWTVTPEQLKTKGKNTPFAGERLTGKVVAVWHRGHLVFDTL